MQDFLVKPTGARESYRDERLHRTNEITIF